MAFYDGAMASVDKGRATDNVYLHLCEASDVVPYHVLSSKLEKDGFEGQAVRQMKNWLDGDNERAVANGSTSRQRQRAEQ